MTTWMRWTLLVTWFAAMAGLWYASLGGIAPAVGAAGAALLVLRRMLVRRRRSELRYVELVKQPIGLF